MDRHLWLIGMMGSGKSLVGRGVADRLGGTFFDTDEVIAARLGCSIAQFWGERGEEAFREIESVTIARISASPAAVVATGGGAVLRETNVAAMRQSGRVVWLTAGAATLAERIGAESGRPLLAEHADAGRMQEILDVRGNLYAASADVAVDTEGSEPGEVIDQIEVWWNTST